jgi:hypothetical protein
MENYGAGFADYNLDGYLDLYICNYNSTADPATLENYLLRNNGDLTFSDVTAQAGGGNGVQLTLGCVWFDYDKDGWPDLFVFNDKEIYDNALYHNNGDGTFWNLASFTGTNHAINAMSGTSGDYNNDGWLDLYVTNGPIVGNLLLKNNSGFTFTNEAAVSGVQVFDMCWSAQWIDYDNNMWQDLYVAVRDWDETPTPNHFFINNGNGTFTYDVDQEHFPNDDRIGWSNALGDLNNDGFQDLVQFTDYASPMGLWLNEGNNNHYIKVSLTGVVSNRDAVGSWIECHAGGVAQHRYTYCGEDYLAQDSQHEIIGLKQFSVIDSLVVHWPSGLTESWYDVQADQHLEITAGSTLTTSLNITG